MMQSITKKVEKVVPGDWYDEREVIGVKDWTFAVDLHFRDGMKMFESGVLVSVVPAAEAIDVIK